MKIKTVHKRFKHLKSLKLRDKETIKLAIHLLGVIKGKDTPFLTPLAEVCTPSEFLCDWDIIYDQHLNKLNQPLLELEASNRSKFGYRSIAIPWAERKASLQQYFSSQDAKFVSNIEIPDGPGDLFPVSLTHALSVLKPETASGLPFLRPKRKCLDQVKLNWSNLLERNDPCMLYTRTSEMKKTRNVWGYPIADTFYEMMFYNSYLEHEQELFHRAAIVSPDLVSVRMSKLIHLAMSRGMILYSVDFARFDASVRYQHIRKAFKYIKSCFNPKYASFLDEICERMISIGIVTPDGVMSGKHGVPSGSTWTNAVDSLVQLGIALLNKFIVLGECMVQGDDGVFMMLLSNVEAFERNFIANGLILETSKSVKASNYVVFCQNLYHIDYQDRNGIIGGIYPIYRAINRLLFHEKFVNFKKIGISPKDYYNIRTISILENCKFHPLFEQFVRYVTEKDITLLKVSEEGIDNYIKYLSKGSSSSFMKHQHGNDISGIRDFESYQLIQRYRFNHFST